MNLDKNGYELYENDTVICDAGETGVIESFGGLGAYVKMDLDSEVIDWSLHQLEKA
jgi:hypothetical protein